MKNIFRSKYRRRIEAKIASLTMEHLKIKLKMSEIRISKIATTPEYFTLGSEAKLKERDINLLREILK